MLINVSQLSRYWQLRPSRILHVGAHVAEESTAYQQNFWGEESVIWIEADPASVAIASTAVAGTPNARVIEALAWDRTGVELDFMVTSNGQSSSALPLGEHSLFYPDIVPIRTIRMKTTALADDPAVCAAAPFDFVNLDIQGAELRALRGLGPLLDPVQAVYTEVNIRPLYEGCALFPELDAFLTERGFVCVDACLTEAGWGDGLWIRREQVPKWRKLRSALRRVEGTLVRYLSGAQRRIRRRTG